MKSASELRLQRWQEEKVPSSRPTSDLMRGTENSWRLCSTPLVLLRLFLCSSSRSNCSFSPSVSSLHLLRPKWPGLFGDPHGSSDHHPRAVRHRASVGSTGAAQDRRDRQRGEKHECWRIFHFVSHRIYLSAARRFAAFLHHQSCFCFLTMSFFNRGKSIRLYLCCSGWRLPARWSQYSTSINIYLFIHLVTF